MRWLDLHSNMVIFKLGNAKARAFVNGAFTFQSGDIRIYEIMEEHLKQSLFTFQSGDIRILYCCTY